jgi:Zn-dependent membrane protease YugP/tetratricopeptide (TPR) repeat protein
VLFPIGALLVALSMRRWTSKWFQRVCAQVGDLPSSCALSGHDVAVRLLQASGLRGVAVMSMGTINCYHPWKRQIRLRPDTYRSTSLTALATAAHEVGHAQHFSEGIWRCRLRNVLWPICWAVPFLGAISAILCILADVHLSGFWLLVGILIVCTLVVALRLPISLPLERDASQRARKLARENGLLADHEQVAFDRVLSAAWKTHASAEAQRWIVLAAIACFLVDSPLHESFSFPPANDPLSIAALPGPEMAIQPVSVVPHATANQADSENDDSEPEYLNSIPWLPLFSPLVLAVVFIPLALLGRSKRQGPTRESKAALWNNAASALHAKGQYEAAIVQFSSAIELSPSCTAAWYNRGQVQVTLGRLEKAVDDFDTAARLAPHFLDAITARGQARLLLGQHGPGFADLESVLAQSPANTNALVTYSDFCQRRGDFERAISVWTSAIQAAPQNGVFYRTRGLMHYFQGAHDRAISDQTEAIRLDPTDAIARNNRGAALLKLGNWAAAKEDLRAAVQLDPKLPNSFRHLAWLQATCPNPEYRTGTEAVSNATQALELTNWKQHEWYEVLAAAYAEAGNFEQAIHWQQKYLDASPADLRTMSEGRILLFRDGKPFRESSRHPASIP